MFFQLDVGKTCLVPWYHTNLCEKMDQPPSFCYLFCLLLKGPYFFRLPCWSIECEKDWFERHMVRRRTPTGMKLATLYFHHNCQRHNFDSFNHRLYQLHQLFNIFVMAIIWCCSFLWFTLSNWKHWSNKTTVLFGGI